VLYAAPVTGALEAVVFDVDGTIAETERDGHRIAFNLAFERYGLPDRWDVELYGRLLAVPGGKERLRHHLGGRGMAPDEIEDLVPQLHAAKNEVFLDLVRTGRIPVRQGIARLLDELAERGVRAAVATTGSRDWVVELISVLLGPVRLARLDPIVTRQDCRRLKPDPELYLLALDRLGTHPAKVVAVEDSALGLLAAKAAGLPCVVVRNGYTREHDFSGADLVVDDLGETGTPAPVVSDPWRAVGDGTVDVPALDRLVRRAAGRAEA
jgi:HAD superfamily hydrolase (TIGR01509 family)